MRRLFYTASIALLTNACLAGDVDDAASDVFACNTVDDCNAGESCLFDRCTEVPLPLVEIRAPEPFAKVATPETPEGPIVFAVSVGGRDLDLVDPISSGQGTAGEGYIELSVDGELIETITAGSLAGSIPIEGVVIPNPTPGAHRISVQARRADGVAYDNPEASDIQLVWVDDGMPRVGIVEPLPGTEFGLGEVEVDVRVATLNFEIVPAASQSPNPHGHAHIHYDDVFPSCVEAPTCDCCYIAIASPDVADVPAQGFLTDWTERVVFPGASAGSATLTAVLRNTSHTPFIGDDGIVFDEVQLQRVSDPGL